MANLQCVLEYTLFFCVCSVREPTAEGRYSVALFDFGRAVFDSAGQVGSLQPIKEIAEACRGRGILSHTDAAQSIGKVPVKVGRPTRKRGTVW